MQSRFLVGTENGLFELSEENDIWNIEATHLPGLSILSIATDGSDSFYAATAKDGLFRVELATGEATPLGAEVLPPKLKGVTIAPGEPETIFVASEPAGIWTSSDGGRSWTENESVKAIGERRGWKYPVKSVAPHIRNILVSYDDPRYVYAAIQVGGILRSEDGGKTFTDVFDGFDPDIHQLYQDPTDPTLLYAVAGGGGWVDEDRRTEPLQPPLGRPLYRSRDRGRTWECISADFDRTYGIGMSAVPTSPAVLVAGVGRDQPPFWDKRETRADAIVVMSRDNGTTWQQCRSGLPDHFATMIEAVEVDRKHHNRVLIGTGGTRRRGAAGERLVESPESAIYVCDDPSGSWSRLPVTFPGIAAIVALYTLSKAENELITRVGPDTPGGALLRRYWYPVLQARALEPGGAPVKLRLLGESFVAFRSPNGTVGMMEEFCPHRRASMLIARNEECGLRCLFHGWKMGLDGGVLETPSEPPEFADLGHKVRTRRIAARESAGLVWAYIGAGDPPQFPAFEFTSLPLERVLVAEVPGRCNWVQLAEGQLDSAHISHLHASSGTTRLASLALADRAPHFDVETTPWGMHVAAIRSLADERRYTRVTEFVMPSWEFIPRPTAPGTAEYDDMARFVVHQTPLDDVTTTVWYIMWHPRRPITREEVGGRWAVWNDEYQALIDEPLMGQDRAKMRAGHMTGLNNLLTEDMLLAETMGPIADRSRETLGSSDSAVARFRRIFLEAIRDNEAGTTPRGCSGSVPYGRIGGIGIFHRADADWRDGVNDLVSQRPRRAS